MANENMDFSFIKDEAGIEDVKEAKKDMLVISKDDFIERTSKVSKQMLEELNEHATADGVEMPPLALMSEMLTHVALLARITNELFNEGE